MKFENPLVSIIIPTYNREKLIGETLQSVLSQTYQNWECIVVDDGSTDCTVEVVEIFCKNDSRFISRSNKRKKGACGARNTGLFLSKSSLIMFLDSDDLLAEYCLSNRIKVVKENEDFELYCFPTGVMASEPFDSNLCWNYLNKAEPDICRFFMQDMPWCTNGVLWRKSLLIRLKGWNEDLFSWQDWELHVRMLLEKNINYFKVSDSKMYIDNFYRRFSSKTSISSNESSKEYILNRMYVIRKLKNRIIDYGNQDVNLEFTKLIFRLSNISIDEIGFKNAQLFFKNSIKGLGYSSLFIYCWAYYLKNKRKPHKYKVINKLISYVPFVYKKDSLIKFKSTHLTAEY